MCDLKRHDEESLGLLWDRDPDDNGRKLMSKDLLSDREAEDGRAEPGADFF
jgi:hypothetical protein